MPPHRPEKPKPAAGVRSEKEPDPKKPFWDRFDTLMKRWQTVCALIVAIGAIVAFVGSKMGWHFPFLFHEESTSGTTDSFTMPPGGVSTRVRYLNEKWGDKVELTGTNPTFETSSGWANTSGHSQKNIYAFLQYDSRLIPIKGTGILKNSDNPNGLAVQNQDSLIQEWMNVGNYGHGANVFIRYTFTLNSDDFPCGDTTMTMRAIFREENFDDAGHDKFAPESIVHYRKACDPPVIP